MGTKQTRICWTTFMALSGWRPWLISARSSKQSLHYMYSSLLCLHFSIFLMISTSWSGRKASDAGNMINTSRSACTLNWFWSSVWCSFRFCALICSDFRKSNVRVLRHKVRDYRKCIKPEKLGISSGNKGRLPSNKHICVSSSTVPRRFHEPNRSDQYISAHLHTSESHVLQGEKEQAKHLDENMAMD